MKHPFDCISDFVFVETDIEKSDIILIPGGSHPQLMLRAADLYRKGFARYIFPSGGSNKNLPDYESEWEYLRTIGVQSGVNEDAILKEDRASNTFENAQFSWDILKNLDMRIQRVILVCKAYHSRRALLTYQSIFPLDINFYVAPVIDKRGIAKYNWFLNEEKIRIVMNETVKIGTYFEDKISKWV